MVLADGTVRTYDAFGLGRGFFWSHVSPLGLLAFVGLLVGLLGMWAFSRWADRMVRLAEPGADGAGTNLTRSADGIGGDGDVSDSRPAAARATRRIGPSATCLALW